ncbi:MAG: 1-deoxy-D-xylulose-5-phosphate synthase [Turicibacter sp.]|nr:1-deoxy-D-xylulose-5-phosphate synthase [Turicibacter sp.]
MAFEMEEINDPSFLKHLSNRQLEELCEDIREFIIDSLSKTGGHLSSNLGVVELTVAMHKVFDSPVDKFIWDVGHQVYPHKILTGRAGKFPTLRQFKGMSGFPKRSESLHDCWETGHASTSLSAAVGMAAARDLMGEKHHIVAVIGDGSLTGGMAYEAINHLGHLGKRVIIILNDNEMSISPNVGVIANVFGTLRTKDAYLTTKRKIKKALHNKKSVTEWARNAKMRIKRFVMGRHYFEDMGFKYFGPVDGHDLKELTRALEYAKKLERPIIIHVKTQKGKGYKPAEDDRLGSWHGVSAFERETGRAKGKSETKEISWSQLICNGMIEITKNDSRAAVITPAMIAGSALMDYAKAFPQRLFDVGIAEEHAVTMAGGMAALGMKPFVSIYSTFLKRAFDQVHHDVARQNLNVVFGIDRAGITGADGETHQGLYDIPMLRPVPNLRIMMPKDAKEAFDMLYTAYQLEGPVAIRYPRGNVASLDPNYHNRKFLKPGSWEILREGKGLYLISFGPFLQKLVKLAEGLETDFGFSVGVVNARYIKPMDTGMLDQLASGGAKLLIYEEAAMIGGLGTGILEHYSQSRQSVEVHRMGVPDIFVQHGSVPEILEELHLSLEDIKQEIMAIVERS